MSDDRTLSHLDEQGRARMVDVGEKGVTARTARAEATLRVGPDVARAVRDGATPKGNVLEIARIAGVQAAKRTAELIPFCHPLSLDHVDVEIELGEDRLRVVSTARAIARTGVEMEALTAASVAALTLYDMLKSLSKEMTLDGVRLLEKSGGRSGTYRARDVG